MGCGLLVMKEKGWSESRAALEAGFSDASHFIKSSRKVLGCTPLEFLGRSGEAAPSPPAEADGKRSSMHSEDGHLSPSRKRSGNGRNPR
ncbi:MAG: hypothetical protein ACREMK_14635, partial [Gemmatimonadota bacterium]